MQPIGNKGWYFKGKKKALFDQQPIDAAYMVCCLEKAYCVTGEKKYLILAKEWYDWFFGNNVKRISIVDIRDNLSCFDSLTKDGINSNQGAESNICFVMANLAANRLKII